MKNPISQWQDLKYGMFIHFGLYSLCGGIWKGEIVKNSYSEQILSHGNVCQSEYEDLVNDFTIENFSAKEIVNLAKESKMNYIVLVTKHHDGFCLFDTKTTNYSTMHAACKRDLVKELSEECKKQGLKFGMYFSWIDWHLPEAMPISLSNSDIIPDEHQKYNIAQLTELLTNYGEVCELWMDMGAPSVQQSKEVYDLAHRLQPNIMVNGRVWNDYGDFLTLGDNEYPEVTLDIPWQTPATIYNETWGYREWQERNDKEGKIKEISEHLTNVLNEGGNYLLNIGPNKDGSVLPFEADIIRGVGNTISNLDRNKKEEIYYNELKNPIELYRYSGSEYYSYKPILTGYKYCLEISKSGKYEIYWNLSQSLKKSYKLALDIDNITKHFSLKQNYASAMIANVELTEGKHEFILHTVGDKKTRGEFFLNEIELVLVTP